MWTCRVGGAMEIVTMATVILGLLAAYAAGWFARGWRPSTGRKKPTSEVSHAEAGDVREPEVPVQPWR
jgi:hypothetical protein